MGQRCGRKMLLIVGVLIGIATYSQEPIFRVEIKALQSPITNKEEFTVSTSIRNLSRDDQSLLIWSCSYPQQWVADNPDIHITDVPCKKNDVIRIELKPGETYDRPLALYAADPDEDRKPKPITFRLGFKPTTDGKREPTAPIWSNAVTLAVNP
jgi:hypothetical protein